MTITRLLRRTLVALLLVLGAHPAWAQTPTETIEYYAVDAVGSTRVVFAPDGTVLGRGNYLPFGESISSANLPPERFTGKPRDPEDGYDYFGVRYLRPSLGRFAAVDPVFTDAIANPQQWNRYAYALNTPLAIIDPTGAQTTGPYYSSPVTCTSEDAANATCTMAAYETVRPGPGVPQAEDARPSGAQSDSGYFWTTLGDMFSFTTGKISNSDARQARPYVPSKGVKIAAIATAVAVATILPKAAGKAVEGTAADEAGAAITETVVAGAAEVAATQAGDHIVLGIAAYDLEATAAQFGGRTLMSDGAWQATLQEALINPSTRFTVSLDGVSGDSVYGMFSSLAQRGATTGATPFQWEMAMIRAWGRQADVVFVRGGQVLTNPFK